MGLCFKRDGGKRDRTIGVAKQVDRGRVMTIDVEKNRLIGMLNIYSDCENCGVVLSDPALLIPDPWSPGMKTG